MSLYLLVSVETTDTDIHQECVAMVTAELEFHELTMRERDIIAIAVDTAIHQATARARKRAHEAI